MKRNKILAGIVCFSLVFCMFMTGCKAAGTGGEEPLSGSAREILTSVADTATAAAGDNIPMTVDVPVTDENVTQLLGLSAENFRSLTEDAYVLTGAIMTHAFELALVKCKDAAAAADVKKQIAEGFDAGQWICVFPEQCFVIDSGTFVLLYAGTNAGGEAVLNAFSDEAQGNVGDINIFYRFE